MSQFLYLKANQNSARVELSGCALTARRNAPRLTARLTSAFVSSSSCAVAFLSQRVLEFFDASIWGGVRGASVTGRALADLTVELRARAMHQFSVAT